MPTALQTRLQTRTDRLEVVRSAHEALIAEKGDSELSDVDKKQLLVYREEQAALMQEIEELEADQAAHDRAAEMSKRLHRAALDGANLTEGGPIYRTMAEYARDFILTRESPTCAKIAAQFGSKAALEAARNRLELLQRTPANTLSSDVGGLQPDQHIAQIFQVIDGSRPLVSSAMRSTLERGTLTYPSVDQRPVVAVQGTEKTEAGNQAMNVSLATSTASTYLGGGDLSWQAINWSTPDALDLWFRLAAADYALKTEQDAAAVVIDDAFTNIIGTPLDGTPTFAEFMTAVGAGGSEVFTNSGRMANTVWLAVDRWWYLFGLTSDAQSMFTTVNVEGVGPLTFVASRGLDNGSIVVGDREGLLVAETAGAPVELRVVEPAIGGVEVGIIGAFEAVVVDPGAFALITTAS